MARTTKEKKARKSANSASAEKCKTQKTTKASKGKGTKPTPAAERSKATKGCSKTSKETASTPQRSQTSRSTSGAKAQSQQAAPTSLFKFRRYKKKEGKKKVKHPKLIVEENETEYGFMGFTEEPKSGHHKNIELTQNPKKGDTRPAYIRKELRYDITENFSEVLENYNLSEEDKKAIIEYLNKRKKKK